MSVIEKAVDKLEKRADAEKTSLNGGPAEPKPVFRDPKEALESAHNDIATETGMHEQEVLSASKSADHPVADTITLPFEQMKALGIVTPDAQRSQIAEEYRTIKRPLLMNIDGRGAAVVDNANLILVTSALPGEGKTFSALNLAMSIAMEQDKTVLFVDADVARAKAAALLKIPDDRPGLIDLLQNKGDQISDVLLHTDIPNLKIIPAGEVHERSTELLASQSMHKLMLEMSRRYNDRVIVFDSPPLLLTSEANVLANLMGQIVFVVEAEKTSQKTVTEALSHLSDDKVIGLVLNKSRLKSRDNQSYYDYGYGYGYGQGRKRSGTGSKPE